MKPISELSPLEIREAVATRVMEWTKKPIVPDGPVWWFGPDGAPEFDAWCADDYMPAYESEIGPAFEVVAKMRENGWGVTAHCGPQGEWSCDLQRPNPAYVKPSDDAPWEERVIAKLTRYLAHCVDAPTLPMAICLAAIAAGEGKS